ncbi:MAG: type II secretion system F family protein [Candidatus Melainabacteria bacterium]|nr:type II secretion system F family protein [Candidatus Melainabacteria bacterium]
MEQSVLLILVIGMLGLCAAALGTAIYFLQRYNNPDLTNTQQRLVKFRVYAEEEALFGEVAGGRNLARLFKDSGYANEVLGRFLERYTFVRNVKTLLRQAGIDMPVDRFVLLGLLTPVVVGILLANVLGIPPLTLAGVGAAVIVYVVVGVKKKRRMDKLVHQLPDALSLMTSSLRAGHSFQAALTIVVSELSDPISTEFSQVVTDINLGIPVKDALKRLVENLQGLVDIQMFSTAVLIQRESGGNLAEVLDKLGYTIRERFKLKRQIMALTGQSRLTGYVLGLAPIILLAGFTLVMYGYVQPLYETGFGNVLLVIALVMQVIGFFVMRKIIDIRV